MRQKFIQRFLLFILLFLSGQLFAATYEAENATLSSGAAKETLASASNGSYVKLNTGTMTFNVSVDKKDAYTLNIHYQNNYGGSKINNINVNGSQVASLTFETATTFTDVETMIRLNAGENEISITSSWGWIDIDYIEILPYESESFVISETPVSPNPTESAQKLYTFLRENFGSKTISGIMTGDISEVGVLEQTDVNAVYTAGGLYPALVGFDFLFASGIKENDSWYQSYTNSCITMAKELWGKGGIPAFTWHWKDPSDQKDAFYVQSAAGTNEYTDFDFTKGFKTGTTEWNTESETYLQMIEDIDHISDLFLELQNAGVAAIFRPIHESGGTWFWWSAHSGEEFAALYRLIFERMVNVNGVKNLVWVFNPQDASYTSWNPGAGYYDVLSVDIYNNANDHSSNTAAFAALKSNFGATKILALSENGPIPDVNNMYEEDAPWSWWMPWYESWSGGFVSKTSNSVWNSNLNDDRIITLDKMPGWDAGGDISDPCKSEDSLKYEAECADYSGDLLTSSCMSGKGLVRLTENNSYIKFTVNVEKKSAYKVYVGYSGQYGEKAVSCAVNSISSSVSLADEACGESLAGSFTFKAGDNIVEITPDWTWAVIDYIRLEADGDIPVYEFEPSDVDGFKVDGNKLLDHCNNEFIMRGVNLAYTWFTSSAYDQLEAIYNAGANAVRIVLSDGKKYGKAADNADAVKAIVDKCKEYGMVAILEVHDETGSDDIEDLKDAANYFAGLASILQGTEAYVIINIANEWHNSSAASNWKDGYIAAIPIIRNAGLRHCIMVDAGGYGQSAATIHSYGLEVMNADTEHNIIFSIHMYGSAGNTNKVKSNIDGVINQDLALCIGEFGWYHSDGDVDEDLILSYCNEKNVGWLAWSWYGNGSPVEYLDMVTSASATPELATYTNISISSWDNSTTWTASCNWGEKITKAWKDEAKFASFGECSTTEINDEYADNQINVFFLNDVNELHIISPNDALIQISDIMGRIIYVSNISEGSTVLLTDSWNNGVYLISLNGETTKLIK